MKDALDKWIFVDERTKNLVLRFRVKEFEKQFFIGTRLPDTPKNREIVRVRRDMIATDIALGRFDNSLISYQFNSKKNSVKLQNNLTHTCKYDLKQIWDKFTEYKQDLLEKTTILNEYQRVKKLIADLPYTSLNKAPQIRDWLLKNKTHHTAWRSLIMLSACCSWAVDSKLILDNPFLRLKIPKPKKRFDDDDDCRAFTLEERDCIIEAFEKNPHHSHYAALIKFLFWTGCRPGEAFALTWGDISENFTRIRINKSCNVYKIKKGTKNRKKRTFPTTEGSKLQKLLKDLRPPLSEYNPDSLVFVSKAGRPLSTNVVFYAWKERIDYKDDRQSYPGVVKELAAEGLVPYLKLYATRHTFITWAISSGISPDKVALWVGDNVKTILSHYVHASVVNSECPDF